MHCVSEELNKIFLCCATQLPARSLYEFCLDTTEGCWKAWRTLVGEYVPPLDGQFSKILVPTVDVVRCANSHRMAGCTCKTQAARADCWVTKLAFVCTHVRLRPILQASQVCGHFASR